MINSNNKIKIDIINTENEIAKNPIVCGIVKPKSIGL